MKFDSRPIVKRFLYCFIPMALFGLYIVGKAGYESLLNNDYWDVIRERLAVRQRKIPAVRGNIYSTDHQLLVGSLPTYTLYADFVIIDSTEQNAQNKARMRRDTTFYKQLDHLCDSLHLLFPERSAQDFRQQLEEAMGNAKKIEAGQKNVKRTFVLERGVSYIKFREFQKLPWIRAGRIYSGMYGDPSPRRSHPYGTMADRLLGRFDTDGDSAVSGLEFAYDSLLRGIDGKMHREKVLHKWTDQTDVAPVDGVDLITTLDIRMQDAAEKILRNKLIELDAEIGVVVLMEVQTGDVKAMVNLERTAPGVYKERINYALTALWEPGSTFKTASMMVALEDGYIHRGETIETGDGKWPMHGRTMKDHNWNKGGYGTITVDECLMFSSNVGVSRIIDNNYHDHPEKYVDGLKREGVGVPFEMQIKGAAKPNVRRPKHNDPHWYKTTLPWMSIGYETQIPPIYTVTFYNAIANNGRMVKPRFVRAIEKDGEVLKEFPVEVVRERICSPHTLRDIHEILERVVNDPKGLGKKAGCKQFKVCGKTGTAQVADKFGSYHSSPARYMVSFAGFYPSENPKYSCVVCIKKSGRPASGGGQAGPVFSELAQVVMAKGVYRPASDAADSTSVLQAPAAVECPDTIDGIVPDVKGLGAREAVALLEAQGMKVKIHGQGRVQRQSVAAGTKAVNGAKVELYLETNTHKKK